MFGYKSDSRREPKRVVDAASLMVLPRQGERPERGLAKQVLSDPCAPIPAAAREGERGVARVVSDDPIDVISLDLEADQVIFAEHGALLFCPSGGDLVQMAMRGAVQHCPYQMLPVTCTIALVNGPDAGAACESCLKARRACARDLSVDYSMVA
ncbi:hypothetical protein [Marimonas arenosa]|uniref:Uncharacterized protein n=1 Tax=Marimonas arenosa TaxID=1795305 RepID=A0AAE4B619_9RHOB|nr:hypothetical protein [Marimonas arenosa]MDQ2089901.1 hypothetical protein [Marimonas arenosa]